MRTRLNRQIPVRISQHIEIALINGANSPASERPAWFEERDATYDEAKALRRRGFATRRVNVIRMGGARGIAPWEIVFAREGPNILFFEQ